MKQIRVEWQGPTGPRWVMDGPVDDIGGAVLIQPAGLVADVERATAVTSHGVGVTLGPVVVGEMTGSLTLALRGDDRVSVGEVHSQVERCFSTVLPGELLVVDSDRNRWRVEALLARRPDPPERSPWAPGRGVLVWEPELRAPGGVWAGDPQIVEPEGGVATVFNPGSLTVFPLVVWSGSGCVIETPAGVLVTLPTATGVRKLSTDPGRGFVVTDEEGHVDTGTWAEMRGLPVHGELAPHSEARWRVVSGQVHFEVIPLTESPWR